MAAYRRVYDSRHLQADCQEPGLAPTPYPWQSSMGYLYLCSYFVGRGEWGRCSEGGGKWRVVAQRDRSEARWCIFRRRPLCMKPTICWTTITQWLYIHARPRWADTCKPTRPPLHFVSTSWPTAEHLSPAPLAPIAPTPAPTKITGVNPIAEVQYSPGPLYRQRIIAKVRFRVSVNVCVRVKIRVSRAVHDDYSYL